MPRSSGSARVFPFGHNPAAYTTQFYASNGPTCVPGRCDAERGNCIVSIQLGYMLSFATCGAGLLWVLFNHRKQALHDRIADTVVIDDGADNGRNQTR